MSSTVGKLLASPIFWQVWDYARRNVVDVGHVRLGAICVEPHTGQNLSHQLLTAPTSDTTNTTSKPGNQPSSTSASSSTTKKGWGWTVRPDAPLPRYAILQLPLVSSLSRIVVVPFSTAKHRGVSIHPPRKMRIQISQETALNKREENNSYTIRTGLTWKTVAVINSLEKGQEWTVDLDRKKVTGRSIRLCIDEPGQGDDSKEVWTTGIARIRVFGSPAISAESLTSLQSLDLQSVINFISRIKKVCTCYLFFFNIVYYHNFVMLIENFNKFRE
eukprot:gb/GECH01014555.1/.p1 GENE.gb/GECH01014555.1/~~gb/GECH01014555.1/.p1  ORF type:complete len:274 (+),score=49.44 gb/GECH01014555.1/:1-822(+)